MNVQTRRRRTFVVVALYVALATLWGTRALVTLFGENNAIIPVLMAAAHIAVGVAVPQWRTMLLPLFPLGVAKITGSDLNLGYFEMLGVGFALLVLMGILLARVAGHIAARRAEGPSDRVRAASNTSARDGSGA